MRLGMFDVSLAYAHIHQVNTTASLADAGLKQINADERLAELTPDPNDLPNFGQGTIINAGRYSSNFDVLSLGLTYHFR
jgi:hypothetical protein